MPSGYIVPSGPNKLLSVDLFGPFPPLRSGVAYILILINIFSKYATIHNIKKANAETVIKKFFIDNILKMGKPKRVLCHHGTQYIAKF